jgi:hypothetical protein
MVYNKKILTSIEPIFERTVPVLQRMFNSVKETLINIITPPPAGTDRLSGIETTPLNEPLLSTTIRRIDSIELLKESYNGK